MRRLLACLPALLLAFGNAGTAHAVIVKGSLDFDDNAFADAASMIVGTIDAFEDGVTNVNDSLSGPDLGGEFGTGEFDQGEIVEILFLDNAIVNADAFDLVVYEVASPDGFDVAVGLGGDVFSTFLHYEPVDEGFIEGASFINAARIDLDDFGLAAGTTVTRIRILEDDIDTAELTGAAAFHSVVPEPSSMALLALGLGMLAARQRRAEPSLHE